MTGGFINGIESPGRAFDVATGVTYSGSLIKLTTVEGQVDLNGAGERPDGYAMMPTRSRYPTVAVITTKKVTVLPLIPGTVVEIPVPATHAAITVGAEVETAASGCVILKDGAGEIVGKAMTALGQNVAGYIKVWVNPRTASA